MSFQGNFNTLKVHLNLQHSGKWNTNMMGTLRAILMPIPLMAMKIILLLLITVNYGVTSAIAAEANKLQIQRADIHVDSARPLAGERSRMTIDAQGRIYFTYTLTAGDVTYLPLGTINADGKVHLDAVGSETTWNVEGWGTLGWPSDLAIDQEGNLHYATRYHGRPYGVDYWLRKNGQWSLESFGHGMAFGGNTIALGLLPDGQPVVLSLDTNRTRLRVWEKIDKQWVSTLPQQLEGISAGDYDMAVGSDGSLWVVFAAGRGITHHCQAQS